MSTVQLTPGAIALEHVFLGDEKNVRNVAWLNVSGDSPSLVRVSVLAALVVFTATGPKLSVVALRVSFGPCALPSTVSGCGLPGGSVVSLITPPCVPAV